MKRLIAIAALAVLVAAFKTLPWWAGVGLVIGVGLATKLLAGRLLKRIFVGAFEAKSAVLRGARARLHAITPAPAPKPDFEEELDGVEDAIEAGPLTHRYLDVGIELAEPGEGAAECRLSMWEPGELRIVAPDARPGMDFDDDEALAELHGVEIFRDGQWVTLEGGKVQGSQRLRLHLGFRAGMSAFRLRYYFEILGNAGR